MNDRLCRLFLRLLGDGAGSPALSGIDPMRQFGNSSSGRQGQAQRLNAAMLITLCGPGHAHYPAARRALDEADGATGELYGELAEAVAAELDRAFERNERFRKAVEAACTAIDQGALREWNDETRRLVWNVFCPEAAASLGNRRHLEQRVRQSRRVRVEQPNDGALDDPGRQILFTSNILLTVPTDPDDADSLPADPGLAQKVRRAAAEPQKYWYDHPIHVGVPPGENEALYGLQKLNDSLEVEKRRGNLAPDRKVKVALSASVTHEGLRGIARPYLEEEVAGAADLPHLEAYVFTEDDTQRLLQEVLAPAARKYLDARAPAAALEPVFGVDGEYGRHYSFLKAVSALWQVVADPGLRATFKIDLDQVFPQRQLVQETGLSFLEHFATPLWGAAGRDAEGRPVELGMIAGALVNEQDAAYSLFTPDVKYPDEIPDGEAVIFYSRLPQAVSTHAEMQTRYGEGELDGAGTCIQRSHVTGGTNGILVDSLRRHRPFTPTFVGRAEDQAYLMSVLYLGDPPHLRYVHRDGLIMRHDKEVFASDALEAAKSGRFIGDLVRTLCFSYYAYGLPWPLEDIKQPLHPFTASFISRIPIPLVGLRLAFGVADRVRAGRPDETVESQSIAAEKLLPLIRRLRDDPHYLARRYRREKEGWDLFYDVLDRLEVAVGLDEPFAVRLRGVARRVLQECRLSTGGGTPS